MISLKVSFHRYLQMLPIIEVVAEIFYDKEDEEEALAISRFFITLIDKAVKEFKGEFQTINPRTKPDPKCNLAILITVAFADLNSAQSFEESFTRMIQGGGEEP